MVPRGLPVARVTKVNKRELGSYQEVEATPTVDFSRLEDVLILDRRRRRGRRAQRARRARGRAGAEAVK